MIHSKRADALSKKITDMHGARLKQNDDMRQDIMKCRKSIYFHSKGCEHIPFQRLRTQRDRLLGRGNSDEESQTFWIGAY